MAKTSDALQVYVPSVAHAAHACGVATTMSTPWRLRGDAAASTSSGDASAESAKASGNSTSCCPAAAATVEALHVAAEVGDGGSATHSPAVAAVVAGSLQQAHAVQPPTLSADAPQQHPPRHKLCEQSAVEAHASPGLRSAHEPDASAQPLHPAAIATLLQHAPRRQLPERHAVLAVHAAPAARVALKEDAAVGEAAGVDDASRDIGAVACELKEAHADAQLVGEPLIEAARVEAGEADGALLVLAAGAAGAALKDPSSDWDALSDEVPRRDRDNVGVPDGSALVETDAYCESVSVEHAVALAVAHTVAHTVAHAVTLPLSDTHAIALTVNCALAHGDADTAEERDALDVASVESTTDAAIDGTMLAVKLADSLAHTVGLVLCDVVAEASGSADTVAKRLSDKVAHAVARAL